MSTSAARRRFLLALGAALLPRAAWAELAPPEPPARPPAGGARAKRFVAVYMPHGRAAELYFPQPGFRLDYEDAILAPFDEPARYGRSFRDELLVIDGLDLAAGFLTGNVGHDAPRVLLTGSGANGRNASLDQFLAVEQRLGQATPLPSLVLAVGNDERGPTSSISYGRGGIPLPKLIHPAATFDALFGAALAGSPELAAARRRKAMSALDFLGADLKRLRGVAPASEREKLEQHATALRDLERRLAPLEAACVPPARVARDAFPRYRSYGGGERYFDAITDLQIELVVRGFACDLTRFATLMLADLSRTGLDPSLPSDIHQDVAHRYVARTATHPGEPASWHALARQNRYTCSKVARLFGLLDQHSLSADTLVLAGSDMGDPGRHSSRSVTTLVLGAGIRGGRVLPLGDRHRVTNQHLNPNNRLLARICHGFGVNVTRFGDSLPEITEGVLEL
jgi:hypothetical protein